MNRRRFLAALGTSALPLAGCLSSPFGETRTTTSQRFREHTADPQGCPPDPGDNDVTVHCGDSTGAVRLTASSSELTMPRDSFDITLHNESDTTLSSSASAYQFYHWQEEEWSLVLQKSDTLGFEPVEIPPGGSRKWRIRLNTAELGPPWPPNRNHDDQEFVFRFAPGTYSFGFRVQHAGEKPSTDAGSESTSEGDAHLYIRQFSVTGDAFALKPSNAVTKTVRRDGTLVVRTQTDREYDNDRRVSLIADRLSSVPDEAASLSVFELYNPGHELVRGYDRTFVDARLTALLRDGLAHYDGSASRIRVETMDTTIPPLGLDSDESLAVVHEGTPWQLSAENGWGK